MKAQFVFENINFTREGEPLAKIGIGKAANPTKILGMEEEVGEKGIIYTPKDVPEDQNTWGNSLESDEIHHILQNWEKEIKGYHSFWVEDEEDLDNPAWMHAQDLEGDFVEFQGEVYKIPKTNIFKRISDG